MKIKPSYDANYSISFFYDNDNLSAPFYNKKN
jgi:hypothetical protein